MKNNFPGFGTGGATSPRKEVNVRHLNYWKHKKSVLKQRLLSLLLYVLVGAFLLLTVLSVITFGIFAFFLLVLLFLVFKVAFYLRGKARKTPSVFFRFK